MAISYSAKSIFCTFGSVIITGFAKDSFVKIAYNTPQFGTQIGAGGDGIRFANNDDSAKITITLLASSPSNAALAGLYYTDKFTRLGALPLTIMNTSEVPPSQASCLAWISALPDREYATEPKDVEWVFETLSLIESFGVMV